MATPTQALPAVEGIGEGVRRSMSRQQREAQATPVLVVNVGIERWSTQRDYGVFEIPERHVWTPVERCAICSTEKPLHDEAMDKIAEAQAKYPPKPGFRAGIGPHDFQARPGECGLCFAPKSLHSPTGRYGVLVVRGTMTAQDWGDRKKQDFPVFSDEIAQCLIREQQLGQSGVFMSRSERPSEEELRRAEKLRDARYLDLVKLADSDWMRYRSIHFIPDAAKRACEELVKSGQLTERREWLYAVESKTPCPRCATPVKMGVAMCVTCGAVLDREKYDAYEPPAENASATGAKKPSRTKPSSD
jgi:hypothetical protein